MTSPADMVRSFGSLGMSVSNWVLNDLGRVAAAHLSIFIVGPQNSRSGMARGGLWWLCRVWRVQLVAWCGNIRLRDGNWRNGRLFGSLRFNGNRSKFGLDFGSVIYGEISLSLEKIDVCPSLRDEMEDEG